MLNSYLSSKLLNDSDVRGWYVQLKGQGDSPFSFLLSACWNVDGTVGAEAKTLYHEMDTSHVQRIAKLQGRRSVGPW